MIGDQEEREKALRAFEENILVIAGAGTGKTSLLTGRVLTALLGQGLSPEQILVTTFTEAAAGEMAERIEKALLECRSGRPSPGGDAARALAALDLDPASVQDLAAAQLEAGLPTMQTIHAFCLSILRDHAREADLPPDLEILDDVSREDLFSSFFDAFLETEFGKASNPKGTPILETDEWDLCFHRLQMEELRELIEEWVSQPRWAELPLDKDLGPLLERAGELHDELAGHIERVRQAFSPKPDSNFETVLFPLHQALDSFHKQGLNCRKSKTWRQIAPFLHEERKRSLGIPKKYEEENSLKQLGNTTKKLLGSIEKIPDSATLDSLAKLLKGLWTRYRERSALEGKLSYNDMIERSRKLICQEDPSAKACDILRKRFELILVDEFQDTDPSQNALFLRLGHRPGTLFVVGDPKQSIYRFRGADMEAYEAATRQILTQGSRCTLSANFRSRPEILSFVNQISGARIIESPGLQPAYEALTSGRAFHDAGQPCVRLLKTEGPSGERARDRRIREARALATELLARRAHLGSEEAWKGIGLLVRTVDTGELFTKELRNMGVPVLKEGGKKFYERFEVQRYLALLGLMVYPHDEAALLAILRSPIGAVPDAELRAYATHVREEEGCPLRELMLRDAGGLGELPERLGEAIGNLRDLRAKVLGLPADLALRALLQDSGLQVSEAASFDGGQRLANLSLLIEDCASKIRKEGGDLHSAFTNLNRQAKQTTDFNEASLVDPDVKAVRVMTIHKAKGLEFDLTILVDLAATKKNRPLQGVFGFQSPSGEWVSTFCMGDCNTPQFFLMEERKEAHERAEERRLEYVAMTRARQELWLSWNYAPKARGSVETPPLLKDVEVGVQVETLSGEEEKKAKPKAKSKLAFDAVEGWIQARKQVEARALESMRKSFLLPSQEEEIFERVKENPEEKGEERERRGALELGTLCHFILLREPRGELEERMELAREWISREQDLGEPFGKFLWEQCAEIFENFEKSVLQERLRAGELRGRELPILHLDAEGKPWRGTVDLLLEEKGELVVVDYKTNKLGREGILPLASRYQGQLQIYTEAIQQAYSLDQPPHGEIWALRSGQSFRYPKA